MQKRPISVTILAWLFVAVGAAGFVFHFPFHRPPYHGDDIWVPLLELVILAAGILILRGNGWARWLALAWMGLHVAISFLNSISQVAVHGVMLVLFAWILFRPAARAWFRAQQPRT